MTDWDVSADQRIERTDNLSIGVDVEKLGVVGRYEAVEKQASVRGLRLLDHVEPDTNEPDVFTRADVAESLLRARFSFEIIDDNVGY